MEFLKVKPKLWAQVSKMLQHKGYACTGNFNLEHQKGITQGTSVQKFSFNKLNNFGRHRADKGNSILPVHMDNVKTLAILDTGMHSYQIHVDQIGKIVSKKNSNELQLADGNLENPLGMLENVLVESCGIKYVHSFAIVDFGQDQAMR